MRLRRPAEHAFDRILDAIPPASGAVVMGTGIVSIALSLDGRETLSRVLLVVAALSWVTLAFLLPARASRDRERLRQDIRTPPALTAVAGTAVLGSRLAVLGWGGAAGALLIAALVMWFALVPHVLAGWKSPTVGASFLLTVATESLAVLAATLGLHYGSRWLVAVSVAPFCLGLVFYLFVFVRFDRRQLVIGSGDHWVTGGALAISTLAGGRIVLGFEQLDMLDGALGALKATSLVLWGLTMLWLPLLVAAEALHPRWSYHVRRWSTVFPFGMYAACSFVVGTATGTGGLTDFARVWVWVAAAVWLIVLTAMLRAAIPVLLPADAEPI
jgi:tellurite resistance protein TehA-like permease